MDIHVGMQTSLFGVSTAQAGTAAVTLNRGVEPRQNRVWRQGRRVSASLAAFISYYRKSRDCNFPLTNVPARSTSHSPSAPGAVAPGERQSRNLTLAYEIYLICSCSQRAIKSKCTQLPGKEKGSCSSPPPEPTRIGTFLFPER